jgi:hypothetical protein
MIAMVIGAPTKEVATPATSHGIRHDHLQHRHGEHVEERLEPAHADQSQQRRLH